MTFPRHPRYKPSGVEWLGELPEHWEVKRLRRVAFFNPSKSETTNLSRTLEVSFLPMEAIGDDGQLTLDQVRPLAEVEMGYTYFADGDVFFAKITPCFENGKGAIARDLVEGIGFGTTELIVARPIADETCSDFIHWLFCSSIFRQLGTAEMYGAGGQKRVPDDFVRNFATGLPPLQEQVLIASFLDSETARIEALVEEQKSLIGLLKEKRQAAITNAVTRGLNPHVPMKPSGIEWLGDVPAHWEVQRLGNLFVEAAESGSEELPILSVSIHDGVSDAELDPDELERKVTRSEDRTKYKRVAPGDLAYNMMRAWQGGFGAVTVEGMVSPAYVVARPRRQLATSFVELVLRTPMAVEEMRRHSRGVTDFRLRLYWEEFKTLNIPFPSYEEQLTILAAVKKITVEIGALVEQAEAAIALLQERRAALISAAVTGKIDVRGIAENAEAA